MDPDDITLRLDTTERWFAGHAPLAQHLLLAPPLAQALPDCSGVLEMTLDHLKQRVQFGTPLSAQQAIRHRTAEVICDLQQRPALRGLGALPIGTLTARFGQQRQHELGELLASEIRVLD